MKMDKWLKTIDFIESDLIKLLASRKVYRSYGSMVKNNPSVHASGQYFHSWITDNYVTYVAMAIRRQVDRDKDSRSLYSLVADIIANPNEIKRSNYIKLYESMPLGIGISYGNQMFTEHAGSGDIFDIAIGEKELIDLEVASKDVKQLATRKFAHSLNKPVPTLTFNDVDSCIEEILSVARRYTLLLKASHAITEPTLPDWENAFTSKWL